MIITPNMSLFAWTSVDDDFDHTQLATNFQRADAHDHTPGKGVRLDGTAAIIPLSITDASIAEGTITGDKISAGTSLTLSGLTVDGLTTINGNNLDLNNGNFNMTLGSINMTNGNIAVTTGSLTLSNGNATLSSGALTLTNGNIGITTGSLNMANGNINVTTGSITLSNGNVTVNGTVSAQGQGDFIAGVQSGDASHLNQVISYGGYTAVHGGLTCQNTGGISIASGDIDVTLGSINLTNGNIIQNVGSFLNNGNITTLSGNVAAGGIGNFVGGVISGSSSAHNQIITYGGMTSNNGNITQNGFDIHIATIGSLIMDNGRVFFNDGGSWYLEHNFDGTHNNILTNAFAYVTTSDERLKANIRDIEKPTALLKALNGKRFDWKQTGEASIGFIAQEVKAVFPEIVGDEVDIDLGNGEAGSYHVMDRSLLVAPLWAACQEMLARIETLEAAAKTK